MLMLDDYPVSPELAAAVGELRIPFSDMVKYSILGVSVMLLLVAVTLLLWEVCRRCTQGRVTQDTVRGNLLYADGDSRTPANYSGVPQTKVADISTEAHRCGGCLSSGSFPYSEGATEQLEEQANHQKVQGSLCFSLYYDQMQSRLVVSVLQAEGLRGRSDPRSLHPFVSLRLLWTELEDEKAERFVNEEADGKACAMSTVLQEWRTRIVKNSCNPLFGDQFSCSLRQEADLQHVTLRMEVKDFDKFSRHVILGEVRVSVGHLKIFYPLELQEDLQTPQKDLVGQVLLSLKFLPTAQRLEVGLLKILMLPKQTRSNIALYSRICVQCNQCKLRHQKTSAVARCQVTVFNQVLMFPLPGCPVEDCKIVVSVYETNTSGKFKNLVGQLTVGKDRTSEDQHWSLMMRSVRQPIARWHPLLI